MTLRGQVVSLSYRIRTTPPGPCRCGSGPAHSTPNPRHGHSIPRAKGALPRPRSDKSQAASLAGERQVLRGPPKVRDLILPPPGALRHLFWSTRTPPPQELTHDVFGPRQRPHPPCVSRP